MVDRRNATSSWSGYSHQGKVGIFLALKELRNLLKSRKDFSDYKLEFEKNGSEDIEISTSKLVISRHQVKAKKKGMYPNDYANVRTIYSNDKCTSGYQIQGTTNKNRFLHVICEVYGWDLNENSFNEKYPKSKYVENKSEVQLYKYPDSKKFCTLTSVNYSPIDEFCKNEIKEILSNLKHSLKDDEIHIDETLFEIKDIVSFRISEAHNNGLGSYPIICFKEIYKIIISTDKREQQSVHKAKMLFEMYWNNNLEESINFELFNDILNLCNDDFKQFVIDLHPNKSIKSLDKKQAIDAVIDENAFGEIFYEFYKQLNQGYFEIDEVKYTTMKSTYRLSLINEKPGEISDLVQKMKENRNFLKASFDVDYLVNGRINEFIFNQKQTSNSLSSSYNDQPSRKDDIFSNNLEFIDIDKTVEKLKGERYA